MITLVLPLLLVSIINVCLGDFEPSTDVISPLTHINVHVILGVVCVKAVGLIITVANYGKPEL
jgi:hypothetical protein